MPIAGFSVNIAPLRKPNRSPAFPVGEEQRNKRIPHPIATAVAHKVFL
jgi:hypothetical protein